MNNLVQAGNRVTYTNTTGATIKSGSVAVMENNSTTGRIGIAVTDILAGANGEISDGGYPEGIFTLAKKVGDVFTAFQRVYWDPVNLYLTTSSSSTIKAGRVDGGTYASAATSANLMLNKN